ncbi:MAG: sigma-70 family RNA polymerase sigma factor [Bacteroidota bacterium]
MSKEEAFVQLIQEHEGIIFKITTIYVKAQVDQQDLYQEIVYQLWKSYDSFQGKSKRSTWLYRVALNTAITRKRKRQKSVDTLPIDQVVLNQMEIKDHLMEERVQTLYTHIQQLNTLEKGLIFLFLEGKKHEEIAQITGLSKTNVGTRLARIKQKLKAGIEKEVECATD